MCMFTCMTTKTITITENSYNLLRNMKKENESFSETIERVIAKKINLSDFSGVISRDSAKRIENQIKKSRIKSFNRLNKLRRSINDS